MEIVKWNKYPSVMSGGKQYFYTAYTTIGERSIVWDKIAQSYILQDRAVWDGKQWTYTVHIPVKTVAKGKKLVIIELQKHYLTIGS